MLSEGPHLHHPSAVEMHQHTIFTIKACSVVTYCRSMALGLSKLL